MNFGKVIGHRGASAYAPENTMAAFKMAKDLGAEWVECDARLTRDGEVVVFHDHHLKRMTDNQHKGWIRWKKYAHLANIDFGDGENLVLLRDLLKTLNKIKLSINIEIKPCFGRVRETTEKVMAIVHEQLRENIDILISSFSWKSLKIVRKLDKDIPIGLIFDRWNPNWRARAKKLSCVSLHCSQKILTHKRIQKIKNAGHIVLAYTVNNEKEAQKLIEMGVDAVFSDYPDLLSRLL